MVDTHNMDCMAREVALLILISLTLLCEARMDHCYLPDGKSQRCLPPFVNAAFGKTVVTSDTCGTPPEQYCLQTGATGVTKSCQICDSQVPSKNHDAAFLTDFNNEDIPTWWQSRTMLHDVQYPNTVNLTLNLNKAFDITYVRLLFHTSRPESFAIYKKKCPECDWQPFQYYSGSCFSTFGIDNKEIVTTENEQKALCTDDFSDISPLTGGNVAFSTLESRPGAYNFDQSLVLQDWVRAVAIRITLNRINTFGDEVFRDPKILKSYYYGISDLSIGGRCTCYGHATECYVGPDDVIQCRCEHNTAGRDCERCADFFNDRPWSRANRDNPGECKACDCNGNSNTCYFDMDLYQRTGSGGHCTNCRNNTDGPHCAYCKPHYHRDESGSCVACECNQIGSLRQQCGFDGRCFCKPGVGGDKCDRCLENYFGLNEAGCRECHCSSEGTVEGTICNSATGACVCKMNVEGMNCDRCKLATMNLQGSNPYGCTSCFCHGHSSVCEVSPDYTVAYILSEFTTDDDGWKGRDMFGETEPLRYNGGSISMTPSVITPTYFAAPEKYLGHQRFSYNQFLEFEMRVEDGGSSVGGSGAVESSVPGFPADGEDVILEGDGFRVTASITSQGNPAPSDELHLFRFRLHEAAGFSPRISPIEFQRILNNLEKIYISSSYGEGTVAYLHSVQLKTAERDGAGERADWVERCDSDGYTGSFSEMCAPGFTRDPPNGGVYAPCVPCNCNGHSDSCDPDTGICECSHNTIGDNCEQCVDGYYFGGDENDRGTPRECQPCPCPDMSACKLLDSDKLVCTNCPSGHAGPLCDVCMDGWFGEPRGRGPCLRCTCNGNIDENAVMNCNRTTGECLKCIHNTTGFSCESCLPGYFGKAITKNPEERCRLCDCNSMGSRHIGACNHATGQCECQPFVEGRRCDRCRKGYWDLESGEGCRSCHCHPIGSATGECDQESGQCECLPGVTGERCDRCLSDHYGLTHAGCTACNCNADGSASLQCGEDGQCVCKEGVFGAKCDQCQENFYDLVNGCKECPACYSLVQDSVNQYREQVAGFEDMIKNIGDRPLPEGNHGDEQFQIDLTALNVTVRELILLSQRKQKQQADLNERLEDVYERLQEMIVQLAGIENLVDHCNETVQEADSSNDESKLRTFRIRSLLKESENKLNQAMMELREAERIAEDSLSKENNMSLLAQEAEDLTNKNQEISLNITETAQNALDSSTRSRESIQEAIDVLDTLISKLEDLIETENKIPAVRKLRKDLLSQSPVVKNTTKAAKVNSTSLYAEAVKLSVLDVDTELMESESHDVLTESRELMPRLDALEREFIDNHASLQNIAYTARENLEFAEAAQNTADQLLAQADAYLKDSQSAVKRGKTAHDQVKDVLTSLKSFDEMINENRDEAMAALSNATGTRSKIESAIATTAETREALGDARSKAIEADEKARQAENIAGTIQASAREVRHQAQTSHGRANRIGIDVETLSEKLNDADNELSEIETQTDRSVSDVERLTADAMSARASSRESERRVTNVLEQLSLLLGRLNSVGDVDDDEIGRLEVRYEEMRQMVEQENLKRAVDRFKRNVREQRRYLNYYNSELDKLRGDVENLESIRSTIPESCSAQNNIEQP